MIRIPTRSLAMALGLALLSSGALAAEAKKGEQPAPPTQEQRAKMAAVHRQMADCLSSDRSMDECRAEMQKSCAGPGMMGDASCSMMNGGHMGMMGGPMHGKPAAPKQ